MSGVALCGHVGAIEGLADIDQMQSGPLLTQSGPVPFSELAFGHVALGVSVP